MGVGEWGGETYDSRGVTIYLDNNATTRPPAAVQEAVAQSLGELWQNPSSVHRAGQAARQRVELARQSLARLIGARPRNLTICGSGTEAIDLAVRGVLAASGRLGRAGVTDGPAGGGGSASIITSRVEHAAVRGVAEALEREEGVRTRWAEVDTEGVVSVRNVEALLDQHADVALVSVQWVNNETGVVQPVLEIGRACRARGVVFHCDATQWVGKMVVTLEDLEAFDLLTFSPHKFHGLKGVGVMYARPGVRVAGRVAGEQEMGRRGGTENVPGIIGAGVAAELAMAWLADPENIERGRALRDWFEEAVLAGVPDAVVNGVKKDGARPGRESAEGPGARDPGIGARIWNTTNVGFPRVEAEALLMLLSERGVYASAGAACSSGSLDPSPVLLAMGVKPEVAHGSLRFSLSRETTRAEVEEAAAVVVECVQRLRRSLGVVDSGPRGG